MTRPRKTTRTTPQGTDPETRQAVPAEFPGLRERRPFMFWAVVIGTAAMVLATVGGLISAIALGG